MVHFCELNLLYHNSGNCLISSSFFLSIWRHSLIKSRYTATQLLGMAPSHSGEELPSYESISKPALAFTLAPPPYTVDRIDDALYFRGIDHENSSDCIEQRPVLKPRMLLTMVIVVVTTGLMVTLGLLLFPAAGDKAEIRSCWNPCSQRSETIKTANCCNGIFCSPSC